MKVKSDKLNPSVGQSDNIDENDLRGYPIYRENEDICKNFQEEEDINHEYISKTKEPYSNNAFRRKDINTRGLAICGSIGKKEHNLNR